MSMRTGVLVVLAIVCGVSAAVGVNFLRAPGVVGESADTVQVVVAAKNLQRGMNLDETAVVLKSWPKHLAPVGALNDIALVQDRGLLISLMKDEPVLESRLASKDAARGMASRVPMGMRAFAIHTPQVSAAGGGFVLPGNKVDVLLTTTTNDRESGGGVTTTLLQNVEVLAVAQRDDLPSNNKMDPREATNVTLLVTPDQAAMLNLGMNKGILHLALRNSEDEANAVTRPATMADLRFHQDRVATTPSNENDTGEKTVSVAVAPPEPEAVAVTPPAPKEPRFQRILTLRGSHRGEVRIESQP